MKKQLLCTSAIALGVAAAPASAQDWNLDWGGFFQQHVAYTEVGGSNFAAQFGAGSDLDGVQMFTNAEIIFTPNITLDNGMTFGVNVQLEALNSGNAQIDESYMSISSDTFGRIDAGYENSAGYKMMVGAPQVGSMAINSPSASAFIPFVTGAGAPGAFRQAALSSYTEVAGNNDIARITYYTPSFSGFTAGISYAPGTTGNVAGILANRSTGGTAVTDIFDLGVNYSQSFGTTDITVAARWGTGDSNVAGISDPETWGIGFQVGFSGFTFGASYAENDNGAATGDQQGYSVGVAYDAAGPWTFGLEAYIGEVDNGAAPDGEYEYYKLAANRDLGPGVSWTTYLLQGQTQNAAGADIDGTAIGTAINLSF